MVHSAEKGSTAGVGGPSHRADDVRENLEAGTVDCRCTPTHPRSIAACILNRSLFGVRNGRPGPLNPERDDGSFG